MIFYFSGTGNSAWVARQLAEGQNEELLSIAVEIDKNKEYKLREGEKVGFVFPVYAWGPPEIVLRFIRRLTGSGFLPVRPDRAGGYILPGIPASVPAGHPMRRGLTVPA